jgi:hypothetical protein
LNRETVGKVLKGDIVIYENGISWVTEEENRFLKKSGLKFNRTFAGYSERINPGIKNIPLRKY